MRVVVTGSSGHLGQAIVAALRPAVDAIGFDRTPHPATAATGDIGDREALRRAFAGADAVVHAAAVNGGREPKAVDRIERVNVGGTAAVLEAARLAGVKRLVLTSTTAVYGGAVARAEAALWVTEQVTPEPETVYERTKLEAERLVAGAAGSFDRGCFVLRCARFFPEPAERTANALLYRGVDVRDAAAAHVLAAGIEGDGCRTLNIAAQSDFLPEDLDQLRSDPLAVLRRRYSFIEGAYQVLGWQLPRTIDRVYVIEEAKRLLGYRPEHNFREFMALHLLKDAWPRRRPRGD